ncbi:BRISC and BRCA1-A complex member 2-like [Nannospalax galili]|uniref:BRISC and BRCA1-A complex member 2-like n=1 Tax=Nannospalax galili TaxID=1026970 RepID=UPI00111C4672|nr:BRISC and BRCA1-A complex member 2-like [Nannospalax galili]
MHFGRRERIPFRVSSDGGSQTKLKMSPEVALNRISPVLSPSISSVVRNGKVGLDATNCLRITDLKSGLRNYCRRRG